MVSRTVPGRKRLGYWKRTEWCHRRYPEWQPGQDGEQNVAQDGTLPIAEAFTPGFSQTCKVWLTTVKVGCAFKMRKEHLP